RRRRARRGRAGNGDRAVTRAIRLSLGAQLFAIGVALAACDAPTPTDDGGPSDAGEQGCTSSLECPGALICADGVCQREGCTQGTEGCACSTGERCGRGADGNPLACLDGVCGSMTCPAGQRGCACLHGEACAGASDTCRDGYCVAAD